MSAEIVNLGELIEPATVPRAGSRDYPILSMTMHSGLVDQSNKFKKRVASDDTSAYKVIRRDQLVVGFPIDEGVLSFQSLYDEAIVSPAYDVWNVKDESRVDRSYLQKFLKSPQSLGFYRNKLRSTTARRRTIPKETFLELKVPLPSLGEQKRIAAILDQADELRRKRQRAIERLNQLSQAIFHEMFGSTAAYPTASLKMLGRVSTGSTPPTSDAESFGGAVPFVTPGDLGSGNAVKRSLTEAGAAKSRLVAAGATFVCCIGATIGKMGIASERSAFNQQINAVEWGERIDPTFGFFAVQQVREVIIHKGKGASTTLPILKKSEFEKLEILVPPLNEQKQFSTRTNQVILGHETMAAQDTALDVLFTSLQHRAFQGEL